MRVATLDDYLDRLSDLSFIEVDVEGHELAFLRGARRAIAEFRPLIQFEANDMASQYESFESFAKSIGFSVCALDETGCLRRLESTPQSAG